VAVLADRWGGDPGESDGARLGYRCRFPVRFFLLLIASRVLVVMLAMRPFAPLLVLGLLHQALCDQIPPAVIPVGVGVNIHFVTGYARDLDLITNAGFRFVRMDFSWEATERNAGVYDWTGYDELTAHLEQRALRAFYILDYLAWMPA
jgi:hypothetical protein